VNTRQLLPPAILASLVMLGVRLHAAGVIGFGDSEALYSAYALHPQVAYLDHPGLIGRFASFVAESAHHAPTPFAAHTATALLATLFPWLVGAAARASGADGRGAMLAVLAAVCAPELAVGLFALTPDLLLAFAWTTTLALAAAGLRASPAKLGSGATLFTAGVLAGVAASAKVTGLLLLVALAVTYASKPARGHAKTVWPWAGLVAGALVFSPIALFEWRNGWPMLRHRLVDAPDSGFSFRNAGALVGGQLLYLTPVLAIAAFFVARDLVRARNEDDAVTRLLLAAFVAPLALLVPLALWSHVAEPHWLAPPMLALLFHFARRPQTVGRRLSRISIGTAAAAVALVYAWVLVPQVSKLAPKSLDARTDISNELYGWPIAMRTVQRLAIGAHVPGEEPGELVVVGPHWVVCAQLDAALEGEIPVGCATPVRDDFDDWYPRSRWQSADTVIFVSDSRFDVDPTTLLPDHTIAREERVTTMRGGRVARIFTIRVMSRRGAS
jgi:Dolichyl-phosphate-mannose-protein mannosyltransferase